MHSVLKMWVFALPYRMQSVLMSGLRGCDTARKDDHSKFVTRALRSLVLNNADPSNTFMNDEGVPPADRTKAFLWDLDSYPMHFVMHTAHAAEIVGYKFAIISSDETSARFHSSSLRTWWLQFYQDLVKALHLNPETEDQLDVRLGFTPAEKAMADLPSMELLQAFQAALMANKRGFAQHLAKHGYGVKSDGDDEDHVWEAGTGTSHGGRNRTWSGGS